MHKLSDKDILHEALNDCKLSISSITNMISESATPALRNDATQVLNSVFKSQKQVFDLMGQKGWYSVQPANQQEIGKAQQELSSMQSTGAQ